MNLLKKISIRCIISSLFLYSFDCIGSKFNVFIPINLINVIFISIFGTVGLVLLTVFKLFI